MNNPPETMTPGSMPPAAPNRSNSNKTILIVVAAVLAVCCLCAAVAGIGGAAYYYIVKPQTEIIPPMPDLKVTPSIIETATPEETLPIEPTPTLEETQVFEATPTIEEAQPPADQPTAPASSTLKGMGVTRAEMMDFFAADDAMTFGEPTVIQGIEMVQGTHTWVCIDSNCAAVSLAGPADDLLAIAVVAPTEPTDKTKTALSLVFLMTAAVRFTDEAGASDIPNQIMNDLIAAQSSSQTMEKKYLNNGYEFTATYDASTHNIGLAVARPRK